MSIFEDRINSTIEAKLNNMDSTFEVRATAQSNSMKVLESKINSTIDNRATIQLEEIKDLESKVNSFIESKFRTANTQADQSDAKIIELTKTVVELKELLESIQPRVNMTFPEEKEVPVKPQSRANLTSLEDGILII